LRPVVVASLSDNIESALDMRSGQKQYPYQEERTSSAAKAACCLGDRGLSPSSEISADLLRGRGEPECFRFFEGPGLLGDVLVSPPLPLLLLLLLLLLGLLRRDRLPFSGDSDRLLLRE
jgi:hypothetical protein